MLSIIFRMADPLMSMQKRIKIITKILYKKTKSYKHTLNLVPQMCIVSLIYFILLLTKRSYCVNKKEYAMRKMKKVLSLVLCVALAAALMMPMSFVSADNSNAHGITTMGDSVSTGYGLVQSGDLSWGNGELAINANGEYEYVKRPLGMHVLVPNSYSGLVANALGINSSNKDSWYFNHCRAGFRTIEEIRMLDPEYDASMMGDIMSDQFILGQTGHSEMTPEELAQFRAEARSDIENSKLVIIGLGMSDLGVPLTLAFNLLFEEIMQAGGANQEDIDLVTNATTEVLNNGGSTESVILTGLGVAESIGYLPMAIASFIKAEMQSELGFANNYRQMVQTIYDINPDCTVVALSMINTFKDLTLTGISPIKAGKIADIGVGIFNSVIQSASPGEQYDYRYCDIVDCPLKGYSTPSLAISAVTLQLINTYNEYFDNLHPMEEGHRWIADRILETLGDGFSLGLDSNPVNPSSSGRFGDVHLGDWFYEAVEYCASRGYMAGTDAGMFSPNMTVSRAMVAQILYAMEGKPSGAAGGKFSDVADSAWYAAAVNWAAEKQVVAGFDDGTFGPDQNVTREQLATMLCSYTRYKGKDTTPSGNIDQFADYGNVSSWAVDNVKWAVGHGIIAGKDGNVIDPTGNATRAEMAQMIYRLTTQVL